MNIRFRLLSLIVTVALAFFPMHSFAAKADPEPQTLMQPDGTMITIVAHGDEFGHFITAPDGALLVAENNALYVAKVTEDGSLTSTGILAHNKDERSFYEQQLINSQDWNRFSDGFVKMRSKNAAMPKTEPLPTGYFPHNGSPKALVILVEFQDSTFHWDNAKEIFDSYLNAETLDPNLADGTLALNYSSVAEYFREMSFGQFRPQFDVVGPVKLPNNLKTYGGGDDNVPKLVTDAFPLIADSADLKQYDLNGDGYIDLIYFICASYSQSQNSTLTNLMWPKVTTVIYDTGKGVKTNRIGISCELIRKPTSYPTPHVSGIGLFCHEFSHTLGLPDLYATSSTAQMLNQTYEYWDLMDGGEYLGSGGLSPNAYSAWERECMGWMKLEELTRDSTLTLIPLQAEGGKAFKVYPEGSEGGKHYYIIENVQRIGANRAIPSHGMLVYDITYNGHSMTPNSSYKTATDSTGAKIYNSATAMTLVPADGFIPISYQLNKTIYDGNTPTTFTSDDYMNSHYSDPYPGSDSITSVLRECKDVYKNQSNGKYYFCTKPGYLGKDITGIREETLGNDYFSTISFTFGNPVPQILLGDANADHVVNVNDISAIASYILDGTPTLRQAQDRRNSSTAEVFDPIAADANCDGVINVNDISAVANIILGD